MPSVWLAQPLPTARGTRFAMQVTSPIVSLNLCIEMFNKWLGRCVWLAVHIPSFKFFTPAPPALSFSSIPWKRWRFGFFFVCLCAHDQPWQRNAHQCFQLGGANCFQRADALRGACYVGVSIRSCITSR